MNKVTSYLKNVGKSTVYATVEVVSKKMIPEVVEFTDTNSELFKASFATVSHFKKSVRESTKLAKQTQIYKDINAGINNALDDIKTGNFYNKARSDSAIDAAGEALAGGFDDFGDDFDFSDWDMDDGSLDDFSDETPSSITKGDLVVADSVTKSSNLSAQLISKTVANTSHNIIKTNMATTNMVMAQNAELVAGIRTSIAGVHESINSILKFSADVITPHFNTQSQYFTDSMAVMKENNAILKEMLEMQRNVYKQQQEEYKSKDQFGNVFSGGTLDLTEYAKTIWKNKKNLDKSGSLGMLFSDMGGSTMLGQMLSNPLGFAVTSMIEKFIPKSFATQVASFSKTLSNMFPVIITRLNKWKKDDKGGIYSILGNLFGLDIDTKKSIDTSKYNKGAVAFDGITRKAIVDVIPEHLSKIESLLSGRSQRTYDFETGKWISAKDIKKKKEDEYENVVRNSFSELNDDIKNFIRTLETQKGIDAKTKRNLEADIYKMMQEFFEGDELFSPERIKNKAKNLDYNEDKLMEAFGEMLSNVPVSKLSSVYSDMIDNKSRYARNMANRESKGYDIFRKIYDNSKLDSHFKFDSDTNEIKGINSEFGLLNIRDKSGFNTLDYLKQILINVSYIREFGTYGGGGNGEHKGKNFDSYSKSFDTSYTPKNIREIIENRNAADKRYNELNYSEESEESAPDVAAYIAGKKAKKSFAEDDDFKNFGKWYKEKNKYMKEMEEIPGDTFIQKWANAQNMKQKQVLIMGSLSDIARKPATLLTGMIATAEKSIYNFLFQAETDEFDDETGRKVKGFFPAMLNKMRASWDTLTTTIDEKFITPLVKKYGLDEKWDNLKEKVRNSKPGVAIRNAGRSIKSAVGRDLSGIYDYTKNSVSEVMEPVIYNRNFRGIHENRIGKLSETVNKNLAKSIDILNGMSPEDRAYAEYNLKGSDKARMDQYKFKAIRDALSRGDDETARKYLSDLKGNRVEYLKKKLAKEAPELLEKIKNLGFAKGGIAKITKSGVLPVSKGEIHAFIPNEEKQQKRDKENETNTAIKYMQNAFSSNESLNDKMSATQRKIKAHENDTGFFAEVMDGTAEEIKKLYTKAAGAVIGVEGDTPEEQNKNIEKQKNNILKTASDIFSDMNGEWAGTASKGLIGGGIGLLLGGPLLGAGIGVASSFIKNSKTVNEFIFGKNRKYDENGMLEEKEGGLISKDIQNTFKKYIPDMGKYGATGAVASLLTPFGPLAGAAIGAGVGFVKNSKTMNEMIFGEEITDEKGKVTGHKGGLLTEERLAKIKHYLPKGAAGALVGAGASLFGPFGILGGAAIGAGAGMLTGTEEFRDLILGEKDSNGNRIGGIKGALQEHFINPIKDFGTNFKDDFFGFIKESMIDPLNEAITPITSEIAFQTKRLVFGIPKFFGNLFIDNIGRPILESVNDRIVGPIARLTKSLFGGVFSTFKGIISAPFRLVGKAGELARGHQIKQGRDSVASGNAKERLLYASKKGINNYKYKKFDQTLADNSDNTEYLEELTARTGMLAHGTDYFNKEIKKAKTEVRGVLKDYIKLGWFEKNNKVRKDIERAIANNDIETAIAKLADVQATRTGKGGPINDDAENAIARFTKASKSYQIARTNRDNFSHINEEDNAAWMEKQFGPNWKSMKASNLFDYARKELANSTNRKAIEKGDLFTDPRSLVTEGDKQIKDTLEKIYTLIKTGKEGKFSTDEAENKFNEGVESGQQKYKDKVAKEREKIAKKVASLGYNDDIVNKLANNKNLYSLVIAAKRAGVEYDSSTVQKLYDMNLGSKEYNLLKKFPNAAFESEKDIKKSLDYTRNNHATIFKNRFFGAKRIRNDNLALMNLVGKAENDLATGKVTALNADQLKAEGKEADDKYTWVKTEYGLRRYYKDKKGDMTLDMSDAETKESLEKEKEDRAAKKGFMGTITNMKDTVLGMFNRNKEKDEEEKKEPWYKKLFNTDLGSKIKFGAAILGLVTGVGAIKNLWDNSKENNGVFYRIGSAVGNAVAPLFTKIHNWFTNEGEYTDTETTGLQGFLNQHLFPNMFKGMDVIFGTILPAVVTTFIKNIPNLIKGALKGVAGLFGWWNKDKDKDTKLDTSKISAKGQAGTGEIKTSGGSSWLSTVFADSSKIATSIVNNNVVNDEGNVQEPNISDETLGLINDESESSYTPTSGSNAEKGARNRGKRTPAGSNNNDAQYATDAEDNLIYYGKQMYIKDKNGNLVEAKNKDFYSGKDIYDEDGSSHWQIDESTGEYVAAEDSKTGASFGKVVTKKVGEQLGRSALTGQKAGIFRIADKVSGNLAGKALKGSAKAAGKIPGIGGAINIGGKAIGGVSKAFGVVSSAGANLGNKFVNATTHNVMQAELGKKFVTASSKQDKKLITRVVNWVGSSLKSLFNKKKVVSKIKDAAEFAGKKGAVKETIDKLVDKLVNTFSKQLTKKGSTGVISKIAQKIGTAWMTPLIMAGDFITGCDQAEAILGILEPTPVQTLVAGLINVISKDLFFGFVESRTVTDFVVDVVFPIFDIDTSKFKEDQAEAKEKVDEYNEKEGDNLSVEEYLKRNNSVTGKIGSKISGAWKSVKGFFTGKNDVKKAKKTDSKEVNKATTLLSKATKNSSIESSTDLLSSKPDEIAANQNITMGITQVNKYAELSTNIDKAYSIMDLKLGRQFGFKSGNKYIGLTEGVNKFKQSDLDKMNTFTFDDTLNTYSDGFKSVAGDDSTSTSKSKSSSSKGFFSKIGGSIKNAFGAIKGFFTGSGTQNSGFVSQLDPKYKSKKFNISGDTEYQTLGDSGCAPATASNVINLYSGSGIMDNASKAALKYKDRNGGVTPDYFDDYLGSNGISTYSTTNKQELLSGIGSGRPTILLGTDPTNKANTPYGAGSSHYVLATGLDGRGNVIIQDPESKRPNALYPVKDLINQSQMGIITSNNGKGRRSGRGKSSTKDITRRLKSKFSKISFGRGSNTINQDLGKWSSLSDAEIDKFIKNTNSSCPFTGKAINKAAQASGLDPRYILAHAAVESAWGQSTIAKKYHNYFGIGAFDSNPGNAKNFSNNGMENGLIQGAVWIRKNFYDAGQTTLYKMRYSDSGTHNYCTSTTWPNTIASIMDRMPPNTNAVYHEADSSVTASSDGSDNTANGLFDKLSSAMLSYYDSNLINLLWGSSDSGDTSGDSSVAATGDAKAVVDIALKEVGYKAGTNQDNKYGKAYGMNNCDWCAIFSWWVFNQAGCSDIFMGGGKSAAADGILNYYKQHNQTVGTKSGKAGDLIFFDYQPNGTADHVGIIISNNGTSYTTVEGNTGGGWGEVKKLTRPFSSQIMAIARPNYASGQGTNNGLKSDKYYKQIALEASKKNKISNVAASMINPTGKGTSYNNYGYNRYLDDDIVLKGLSGMGNTSTTKSGLKKPKFNKDSILVKTLLSNKNYQNPMDALVQTGVSGRGTGLASASYNIGSKGSGFSLPGLSRSTSTSTNIGSITTGNISNGLTTSSSRGNSTENLLSTIIEILQIIANNSEKLSEIVSLLSRALDLNLTDNDISGLSSNNAQVKNKIANALKKQGSMNGLGDLSMSSSTESLAAAMYSIARA